MREILRHCSQRETPQRNDTGAGVLSMRACAPHTVCGPARRPATVPARPRDAGASLRVDPIDQLLRGASICELRLEEELQRCDDLRTLVLDHGRQLHRAGKLGVAGAASARPASGAGSIRRRDQGAQSASAIIHHEKYSVVGRRFRHRGSENGGVTCGHLSELSRGW